MVNYSTGFRRKTGKHFVWATMILLVLGMSCVTVASAEEAGIDPKLEKEVSLLMSLPHGPYRLSPENKRILKRVIGRPDVYVPVVERVAKKALSEDRVPRTEAAAGLLLQMNSPLARTALGSLFLALDARVAKEQDAKKRRELEGAEAVVLSCLGRHYDEKVVSACLERLRNSQRNSLIRGAIRSHLLKSCAGNEKVIQRLKVMVDKEGGPLYKNPALLDLITKMKENKTEEPTPKQEPGAKPKGKDSPQPDKVQPSVPTIEVPATSPGPPRTPGRQTQVSGEPSGWHWLAWGLGGTVLLALVVWLTVRARKGAAARNND